MQNRDAVIACITVVLLALAVGINDALLPAFANKYVINDDVRMHIYWMRQFQDADLFRNDLLTEYAKQFQPWGFILFYYLFSFIIDPIVLSKILPVVLFVVFILFVFKFLQYVSGTFTGFLGALVFIATPYFLSYMFGGHARGFAFPLLAAFLYYMTKKDYPKTSLILVLQSLFYPMVFLVSVLTYTFSFVGIDNRSLVLDRSLHKWKYYCLTILICGVLLGSKQLAAYNSWIGPVATKKQMLNDPAFYEGGRTKILPVDPLPKAMGKVVKWPSFAPIFLKQHPKYFYRTATAVRKLLFLITALFIVQTIYRRRMPFPSIILFFLLSAIVMYKVADFLMLRLYIPDRYLRYPVPLAGLAIFTIAVTGFVAQIKKDGVRKTLQIFLVILAVWSFDSGAKRRLIDQSHNKELYEYLSTLPKNATIAAHPDLSSNIPTFAQRKVFLSWELAEPIYTGYWKVIKKRSNDFFDACYAKDLQSIRKFCEKNGIDYLVVDKGHFTKEYIRAGKIFFEPFNRSIVQKIRDRSHFALCTIPQHDMLFVQGDVFVIDKSALR